MLEGLDLFEHLIDEDRRRLAEVVGLRTLEAGTTLFTTGEPGESLFVVRSGEIELFMKDTTGEKIVLAIAGSGEIFGELALLDRGARTATAVAMIDTELLERPERLLHIDRVHPAPDLEHRLLRQKPTA
jgi:CRP-like cAMP-binding protein